MSFKELRPLLTSTRPPSEAPISLQDLQSSRTDCVVVVGDALALLEFEEVVDVGDDGRRLGDAENVGAEAEYSGGDVLVGAVNQADDGDDGGYANDHANEGQDAAQLVRPEAARGNSHSLLEVHCGRLSHGGLA